jgi:hypothetical protein
MAADPVDATEEDSRDRISGSACIDKRRDRVARFEFAFVIGHELSGDQEARPTQTMCCRSTCQEQDSNSEAALGGHCVLG